MTSGKVFLREKFIEFQVRIAELSHLLARERNEFQEKEKAFLLGLLDILDAFERLEETVEEKKDSYDKSARMLSKNARSIHNKLLRLIKSWHILPMTFPDNTAHIDRCKVIETRVAPELEDQTILLTLKKGYINTQTGDILRKAEVVTVLNKEPSGPQPM